MKSMRIIFLGLGLAACESKPVSGVSDTGVDTTGDTSTGGVSTSTSGVVTSTDPATTTMEPGTETSASGTTAIGSTTGTSGGATDSTGPDVPPEFDCDGANMPESDCPEGQKCTIEDDISDTHCVDVVENPKGLYEPCTILQGGEWSGFDDCDKGLVCWDVDPDTGIGQCIGFCLGPPNDLTCADPQASCSICQECAVGLCLPGCDPLLQNCGVGETCIPDTHNPEHFICVLDASGPEGQAFDPCEFSNACDPGHVCTESEMASECDPMATGCCLPFCNTAMPECPGEGLECRPWYEEGMAPAGLEEVGVCALPKP